MCRSRVRSFPPPNTGIRNPARRRAIPIFFSLVPTPEAAYARRTENSSPHRDPTTTQNKMMGQEGMARQGVERQR